jgi:hypothetical protein
MFNLGIHQSLTVTNKFIERPCKRKVCVRHLTGDCLAFERNLKIGFGLNESASL